MEKKRTLVTSNHEPEDINVIWHDSNNNTFKEYSNGNWNSIVGETKQKTIEIGYFGNDPELLFQQNIYAWNCLGRGTPTVLTDDFDFFKSETVIPGVSTDPEDTEALYDFVFKYYVLPVNELIKELDKGNKPIIKIIPIYGSSDGLMPFVDATIITSYNIQIFITHDQLVSLGFSSDEATELLDKYKNKISIQIQNPDDNSQIMQLIKPTFITSSVISYNSIFEQPLIMLSSMNGLNVFLLAPLEAPMINS